MNLTTLFAPLIAQLLELAAQVGIRLLPVIKEDAQEIIETLFAIMMAYFTMQMNPGETSDSFKILVNELKVKGDTLLGKLEVEAEKLPAEISAGLMASFTSIPGALLKLIP
jgi:hypothetical protein